MPNYRVAIIGTGRMGGLIEDELNPHQFSSPYGPYLDTEEPPTDGEFARQWFTLFEEGARQILFLPGIDGAELRDLLHILCADSEDNEDIVTALWRKELKHQVNEPGFRPPPRTMSAIGG